MMVHIGVIGTGGMGGRHIRNLAGQTPGAQVVAVMDIDRARAEAVASQCGAATVYTDAAALIADAAVEAVVITSPDPTHAELALACLAAGKPALCEKPLATTLADTEKVLRAELAGGRRLIQMGFMREYDPAHRAVKAMVERGEIGQSLMFRGTHSNLGLGQHRTTAEVIINSAIHDIHSARWLLNQEVAQVYVQRVAADETRPETCRLLLIQMTFKNGSLGLIEVNADSGYGYQVDVELTGDQGFARTAPGPAPVVRQAGKQFQTIASDWLERFEAAYIYEVQDWVHSLIAGQPASPSVWDGYADMVVADACVQSAKNGQPQSVPKLERPALYTR
ncbi:MAG: Gfo/Idh/MocA family oxidoreductase [Chloroflexi bacterium]|nr:Gfo/Idh/MocA family oxidoreductase [Chloroflexota bacterium]